MRGVTLTSVGALALVAGLAGCDSPAEPDPYAERVQADIAACAEALDELASCGPEPDCQPSSDPATAPFSLRILINCAASACAGLSGAEADQCRFDAMVSPGPSCADARDLCRDGGELSSWLAP